VSSDVVDPAKTALIVIDPQHDFCSPRGAMATRFGFDMKEINEAVPRLNALIEACRQTDLLVVWVREVFADDKMRASHKKLWGAGDDIWLIREDGEGIDWYSEMIEPRRGEPVITKWQYDGFEDTDLNLLLQSRGIETLLMTGFTSNVCVETTARHGYIKGYDIVFVADCAGAPTPEEHQSAIHNIGTYFGKVAESDGVVADLQEASAAASAGG
jgi:ureidoacrylate peracid hydrolase